MNQSQIIKKYFDKIQDSKLAKQKNPLLVIFIGIPTSGKTTLAKFLEEKLQGIRIASDDIKLDMFGAKDYDINQVFKTYKNVISKISSEKVNIISDANSAQEVYRKVLQNSTKKNSYTSIIVWCHISISKALKRMGKRRGRFISTKQQLENYINEIELPASYYIKIDTGEKTLSESKKNLLSSLKNYYTII